VLGGQLAAAKLNVDFDDAGVFDSMKSQTLAEGWRPRLQRLRGDGTARHVRA
jgi:hypothetical protein